LSAHSSQLENGKVNKPSPNVLHRVAEVHVIPCEALMEKAGTMLSFEYGGERRKRSAVFVIDDPIAEEEELLEYPAFIRSHTLL
jgi:hypothetical protein